MDEFDIKLLERRVDELIRTVERLRDENRALRESQGSLLAERARLMEKTETARIRVEEMIERLKALEKDA